VVCSLTVLPHVKLHGLMVAEPQMPPLPILPVLDRLCNCLAHYVRRDYSRAVQGSRWAPILEIATEKASDMLGTPQVPDGELTTDPIHLTAGRVFAVLPLLPASLPHSHTSLRNIARRMRCLPQ
jgi:hypothetical protein